MIIILTFMLIVYDMMRESVKASVAYPGYEDGAIVAMIRSRRRKKNGRRKDVFRLKEKASDKLNREG